MDIIKNTQYKSFSNYAKTQLYIKRAILLFSLVFFAIAVLTSHILFYVPFFGLYYIPSTIVSYTLLIFLYIISLEHYIFRIN